MKSDEALRILEDIAAKDGWSDNAKSLFNGVKKAIGRCLDCNGHGFYLDASNNRAGFRGARQTADKKTLYIYPCSGCSGKGNRLAEICSGCGSSFHVSAFEDQPIVVFGARLPAKTLCPPCRAYAEKKHGLIPLQPCPEPVLPVKPSLLEKIQKAHEEADSKNKNKGGKR